MRDENEKEELQESAKHPVWRESDSLQARHSNAPMEGEWTEEVPAKGAGFAKRVAKNYLIPFTKNHLWPFVRRRWIPLLVSVPILVVGIYLLINVGLLGTALIGLVVAYYAYLVIKGERDAREDESQESRGGRRRKSNRKVRRAKWRDLEEKHGKGNVKCPYCWVPMPRLDSTVELDHKNPTSKGGGDDYANLHLICINCNGEKSDLYSHREFMDKKAQERQERQRAGRRRQESYRRRR